MPKNKVLPPLGLNLKCMKSILFILGLLLLSAIITCFVIIMPVLVHCTPQKIKIKPRFYRNLNCFYTTYNHNVAFHITFCGHTHTQQNGVTIRTSVSWTFVPHKEVFVQQQQQPPFSAPVASMYQSVPTTSNPKYTGVQIKRNISNSPKSRYLHTCSCSAMIFT